MILVIDCGNSMIKLGLFNCNELKETYSIKTDRNKSSDEYAIIIQSLIKVSSLEGSIISSVVPSLTLLLKEAIKKIFKLNSLIISKSLKTGIPIKIDNPSELGADMLSGAIGAYNKFKEPCLVCDLGTATKIYVVDKNGSFIGGIITSGLGISLKTLVDSTSLLIEVPLIAPSHVIGKNTKDSIQSGIVLGHTYMINEFANKIEKELGYKVKRIVTGGYSSSVINGLHDFIYEKNVVLEGLLEIYKRNSYEK